MYLEECSDDFNKIRRLLIPRNPNADNEILLILKSKVEDNSLSDLLMEQPNYENNLLYRIANGLYINSFIYIINNWPEALNKLNIKNKGGLTPLHITAMFNGYNVLKFILTNYKDHFPIDTIDGQGNTILHTNIYYIGSIETIELLLQCGASLNIKNKFGHTPLDVAIERSHARPFNMQAIANRDFLLNYQDLPPF